MVGYASADRFGLALSGGGIRSATFNLGLLQSLHRWELLKQVDYISTVSGGGYIGGWLTAFRNRRTNGQADDFPGRTEVSEPPEVLHLRRFSNFLAPRWGFLETESWNAVLSFLGGLLPSLTIATAVLAFALLTWVALLISLLYPAGRMGLLAAAGVPLLLLVGFELEWRRKAAPEQHGTVWYSGCSLMGLAACWGAWWGWPRLLERLSGTQWPLLAWEAGSSAGFGCDAGTGLASLLGVAGAQSGCWLVSPRLFDPAAIWGAAGLALLVARLLTLAQPFVPVEKTRLLASCLQRAASRLLGAALVSAALALVWLAGSNLHQADWLRYLTAGGAAGSAGLFGLLRSWIGSREDRESPWGSWLKGLLPLVLAYAAIGLALVLVAWAMVGWLGDSPGSWLAAAGIVVAVMLIGLVMDPTELSLHAFYRERIARAYLGASNADEAVASGRDANLQTDVRKGDDIELRAARRPPIHLICCTANDLSGDHLENLSRGGRSAVLSCDGLSLGGFHHCAEGLKLSSALTASAAAMNANMGSLSMSVGPGVSFLMSALNLRLGLWMEHPLAARREELTFSGWKFYCELFGWTRSGTIRRGDEVVAASRYVHLSDGGHFENLALYELVRRHCRYIIVSDCGADPAIAFTDLGNAVRRIREDFGVEISLDVDPLKPRADGLSSQHVAVGTIRYGEGDVGVLLYFKPALTGDEPQDIRQYKVEDPTFPHQTTIDQFYDEAQWESYRRLGQHAADSALRFLEGKDRPKEPPAVPQVFFSARQEWYPTPPELRSALLELTGRYAELERYLSKEGPDALRREMYPELEWLGRPGSAAAAAREERADPGDPDVLASILLVLQFMEDAYNGCLLETHWNHPINLGWMNLFHRWAWSPTIRLWWPILQPMYGSAFRRFVESRLELRKAGSSGQYALTRHTTLVPDQMARQWWERMKLGEEAPAGGCYYAYTLTLTDPERDRPIPIQVGLALVQENGLEARWASERFFVPPSLWGSGIGGRFLSELLATLESGGIQQIVVALPSFTPTDVGSRAERADLIEFYKSRGFTPGKPQVGSASMELRWAAALHGKAAATASRPARPAQAALGGM